MKKYNKNDKSEPTDVEQEPHIPLYFPQRVVKTKKKDEIDRDKEILDTFRKVKVNIILPDLIKKILKYMPNFSNICAYARENLKGMKVST